MPDKLDSPEFKQPNMRQILEDAIGIVCKYSPCNEGITCIDCAIKRIQALYAPVIEQAVKAEHDSMIKCCVDEGNDAYRRGMKTVVDWINKFGLYWRSVSTAKHDYYIPLSLADTYQAKLEEWGLKETHHENPG